MRGTAKIITSEKKRDNVILEKFYPFGKHFLINQTNQLSN